jgi:AAA+ superfamily predicted ATPase
VRKVEKGAPPRWQPSLPLLRPKPPPVRGTALQPTPAAVPATNPATLQRWQALPAKLRSRPAAAARPLPQPQNVPATMSGRSGPAALSPAERTNVTWDDVIGLHKAKRALHEAVVLPTLRSDIFHGIRAPMRGILLFGPPGTGKTLLAKAAACAAGCTFFPVSAASLTSKWHGEGERLVRELFEKARHAAPSIIFVDEVDALLGARSEGEHDASRRLKTEFLVQLDGITTGEERVLVLAATNRPADLDDAVVRRLPMRIFIPIPDSTVRRAMLQSHLKGVQCRLNGALWHVEYRDNQTVPPRFQKVVPLCYEKCR